MTENDAKNLVAPILEGSVVTEIQDYKDLFAIYFVNKEFYKTQDFKDLKIGAGPIIIVKNTKEIFETASGQSAKDYVKAYHECGSVYGRPSRTILLKGLMKNENSKIVILGIKKSLSLDTRKSRDIYNRLLKKEQIKINCESTYDAKNTILQLNGINISAKQLWEEMH